MQCKKRYLLIASVTLGVSVLAYLLYFFWNTAYGFPYGTHKIDSAAVPHFDALTVDYKHTLTAQNSLPILGSAIIDIDNDGIPEVFFGGGNNQPDALFAYRNNMFILVTEEFSLNKSTVAATYGVAVIDSNNDGHDDLYVARDDGVYLYVNKNGASFEEIKLAIQFKDSDAPLSLALVDLNNDTSPDLFISTYLKKESQAGATIFNQEGYGAESMLLINKGDNTFTNITDEAGLRYTHNTFQGLFADLDNDSLPDLVVAYDTGTVKTWKNKGDLTFVDISNPTTNEFAYPMGIAAGDYNNDGLTDLAFSNIGDFGPMTFLVRGDLRKDQVLNDQLILLKNNGDFTFTNTAETMKLANYEFSWGAVFADFNNDAKEDLVLAQNYVELPQHKLFKAPGRLLLQGESGFVSVESSAGTTNRKFSISPLVADFNRDGQLDLVFANLDDAPGVFINEGNATPYLGVVLPPTVASLGATVVVHTTNKLYSKKLLAPQGLASDSTHELLFGLPGVETVDSVSITYLDGRTEIIASPELNTYVYARK